MILETGQNVLPNVEEELRQELEPAQTLFLHTEELTVKEIVLKQENVTRTNAKVRLPTFTCGRCIISQFIIVFLFK